MISNSWSLSILIIVTYFLAAIPFGYLVAKLKNIDLRQIGSGNIGATNVYRAMGLSYALFVFLLDALKGGIPTYIAMIFFDEPWIHIGIGSLAIVGHSLSIYVKFKGGKGVATGLGVLCALSPLICGVIVIMAIVLIYTTRYVALTSIVGSIMAPCLFYILGYPIEYVSVLCVISVFIIIRHKTNIKRLWEGNENKV